MVFLTVYALQQRMLCDIPSFKGSELILRQVIRKSKDEELLIVESLDKRENIRWPLGTSFPGSEKCFVIRTYSTLRKKMYDI